MNQRTVITLAENGRGSVALPPSVGVGNADAINALDPILRVNRTALAEGEHVKGSAASQSEPQDDLLARNTCSEPVERAVTSCAAQPDQLSSRRKTAEKNSAPSATGSMNRWRQLFSRLYHQKLTKPIILFSKRLLPNRTRARAIIAYQRSMNRLRYGDAHFPRAIAIEISVFCNRTCHYCPNSMNKTPKVFMSEEMFDLALQRLVEIRWRGIIDYNFYNEPTADARLVNFVKKTREALPGAMPRVITNGDYLTRDYVCDLIQAGVVNFSISRHFPVNEVWDRKIGGLVEEFHDYITLHRIWPRDDLSNRGGAVQIAGYKPISKCDAPAVAFNILHSGDVILCCCDYKRQHVFGNIRDSSLLDIWRNPEFVAQRKHVRDGTPRYDICKACFGRQ